MNKRTGAWLVISIGLFLAATCSGQQAKTDLAGDRIVEDSATNFVLTAKAPQATGKNKVSFALSVPEPGKYMLLCFIDGKASKPVEFQAPGAFELSTRGLASGLYRITLQLIDSQGRVGKVTHKLELHK